MTQTITPTDPTVAALQESVRHNEKNIDRLDRDLKDFRSETLKQFEKVDQRFDQLEAKVDQRFEKVDDRFEKIDDRLEQLKADVNDRLNQLETKTDQRFDKINDRFNQITMLLVAIVGLIVAAIVKLVFLS
jgi:DNA anti-recombination protein RmuC